VRRPVRTIAEEITRYCVAHAGACDTLDGVMLWVHIQRNDELRSRVSEALEWLVERGTLKRYRLGDGSVVFGLRRKDDGDRA
jgi:hypothetical protein